MRGEGARLCEVAMEAAQRAGEFLRSAPRPMTPEGWGMKANADWVTEVDRASEQLIRDILLTSFPDSRVIGEELSPEVVSGGLVWVVDPLDGTTNFLHRFPVFAVSIAAAIDGVLEAGVVLHVPLGRLSHAIRGGGAWEGDQPLRVSSIAEPRHALIGTGFPYRDFGRADEYLGQLNRVLQGSSGVRRAGAASIDLADVAAGRYEGFWELRLSPWDIAAGTLLIREAGGRVTDFTGRDLGIEHSEVLAGNPVTHQWLLQAIRSLES